jgi:hypothetical protein
VRLQPCAREHRGGRGPVFGAARWRAAVRAATEEIAAATASNGAGPAARHRGGFCKPGRCFARPALAQPFPPAAAAVAPPPRPRRHHVTPQTRATAAQVVDFCKQQGVGLVMVGPEAPLVAGLVDALDAAGVRAFGPSAAAAQLEGSKKFMKVGGPRGRAAWLTVEFKVESRFTQGKQKQAPQPGGSGSTQPQQAVAAAAC